MEINCVVMDGDSISTFTSQTNKCLNELSLNDDNTAATTTATTTTTTITLANTDTNNATCLPSEIEEIQETEVIKFWESIIKQQNLNNKLKKNNSNANSTAIGNRYCDSPIAYTDKKDMFQFVNIYRDLIHSGQLTNKIISMELSYWSAVADMLQTRDLALMDLEMKSTVEIESAIRQLGKAHTEDSISSLSSILGQDMAQMTANWNRSIDALKDSQREEFRDKLKEIWTELNNPFSSSHDIDKLVGSSSSPLTTSSTKSMYSSPILMADDHSAKTSDRPLEESFTINLGAQLKMTHNLRLIAVDSLHFCNVTCQLVQPTNNNPNSATSNINELKSKLSLLGSKRAPESPSARTFSFSSTLAHQRTQTAMSLYSNNLSAIVLFVDGNFKSHYGIQKDFFQLCNKLTEFHFDSLDKQLNYIRDQILPKYTNRTHLETGDCYISRHSNLANAHVVFHLVTDDSLKTAEINSRHPIISSLRNILKLARMYDIKTISIPLLLLYEMNEEILTVNWCLRRAELVLKCVKGFLIEMAFLSTGVDQGTIQFIVPKGISEDLFTSLSSLIPEVFRLSNPLNLKSS